MEAIVKKNHKAHKNEIVITAEKTENDKEITFEKIKEILNENKPRAKKYFSDYSEIIEILRNAQPKTYTIKDLTNNIKEVESLIKENHEALHVSNKEILKTVNKTLSDVNNQKDYFEKLKKEIQAKIETIGQPTDKLIEFFKQYNFDFEASFLDSQIQDVSESMKDEQFKKNLKLIHTFKDDKLKREFKRYECLMNTRFINALKRKKNLTFGDKASVLSILLRLSNLISNIKYYKPEEAQAATTIE